ncbi:MAG TPA: rod shape-determining protein MreD [Candidatus Sulfomarinibacteraceae bacterium]|nr:rod shape-determining protein MreD [Candidatus Sulfomarinibacteraceae bacterium]
MNRSIYLGVALMVVLTILQATLFARFPILDVPLQPALVATLAWGLLRGPYEGLVWAFIGGILLDIFSITPTGATALSLMAATLLVIYIQQVLPENPYLFPVLLTALGMTVHLLIYTGLLWVAQYGFNDRALALLPAATFVHALLAIPIYWLLHYVDRLLYPPRIEA